MEREKLNFSPENLTAEQAKIVSETRRKKLEMAEKRVEAGDAAKMMDEIGAQAKELQKNYPDYREYFMYHLFIGSTLPSPCAKFDFPGEDSVEKFVDGEYQKMFSEEGKKKE